ncbi:hypothetical protein B0H16DRAFT_1732709 [Mycena metata]|uniref:Uncharacterized protein n=1 Tax=Mycena metata TaxID=1033252 RepID=A0AAD7I0T5_9AGAR|nr:hypothetical protein B0H16DRAFT_1732709 [Mycena metata]
MTRHIARRAHARTLPSLASTSRLLALGLIALLSTSRPSPAPYSLSLSASSPGLHANAGTAPRPHLAQPAHARIQLYLPCKLYVNIRPFPALSALAFTSLLLPASSCSLADSPSSTLSTASGNEQRQLAPTLLHRDVAHETCSRDESVRATSFPYPAPPSSCPIPYARLPTRAIEPR